MPPATAVRRPQPPAAPDQGRRSSGRQIRSSISRPTNYYARPFGSFSAVPVDDYSQDEAPPGFFPAIQYFSDTVAALPKEVMRHFTLMKEVEAKIYGPTQEMVNIADRIGKLPIPPRRSFQPSRQALLNFTANNSSAGGSAAVSMINGTIPGAVVPAANEGTEAAAQASPQDEQLELQRRQEFYNLRIAIGQILSNLDEKNGCLAEANRTLDTQLGRLDSVMPYVESEISEEARLGSLTHWAYADNRKKHSSHQGPERSRRDFAATSNLAAAAAAVHEGEIAAARNEGRSHAKKSRLQQHIDSELDDRIPVKKSHHKGRKVAEVADSKSLAASASAQASKKRKIEKPSSAPMERSASTATKAAKAVASTSRSTPAAELIKKKTRPPAPPVSKRRNPTASSPGQSPRMAASPTMATFAMANELPSQRPSSRMRQISSTLQHSILAGRTSPPKDTHKRSNGVSRVNSDEQQGSNGHSANREGDDVAMTDANDTTAPRGTKDESTSDQKQEPDGPRLDTSAILSDGDLPMAQTRRSAARSRDPSNDMRRSVATRNGEHKHSRSSSNNHILKQIASFNRSPVMGRRSLPGTDDDSSNSESRSNSRSKRTGRSRNRQGSSRAETPPEAAEEEAAPTAPPELEADVEVEEEEDPDADAEDHDPDDPDEPKYCYCGRGSYGTMIGCENENCEREWFHLECTGLREVPSENVKWYCDDCDPRNRRKSRSGRH